MPEPTDTDRLDDRERWAFDAVVASLSGLEYVRRKRVLRAALADLERMPKAGGKVVRRVIAERDDPISRAMNAARGIDPDQAPRVVTD